MKHRNSSFVELMLTSTLLFLSLAVMDVNGASGRHDGDSDGLIRSTVIGHETGDEIEWVQ